MTPAAPGWTAVCAVDDIPPLGAPLRRLIEWTANYYLAPPAAVLRMALASASARALCLRPKAVMLSAVGPMKVIPAAAQASANSVLSERKP